MVYIKTITLVHFDFVVFCDTAFYLNLKNPLFCFNKKTSISQIQGKWEIY